MQKTRAVPQIRRFRFLDGYVVEIEFRDKRRLIIDLEPYLRGPVFDQVREPKMFRRMFIEEGGGLAWPSGADICPTMLYHGLSPAWAEEGQ